MLRSLSRLLTTRRSAAAIEYALIAPYMLILFIGTIEIVSALRIQAKVQIAAGQLAEYVAGQPVVYETSNSTYGNAPSLGDMCTGAKLNLLPFNTNSFSAAISSDSIINGPNGATWSELWEYDQSCAATAAHVGVTQFEAYGDIPYSMFTVDGRSQEKSGGTFVIGYAAIVVVSNYTYRNILPYFLSKNLGFSAVAVARPRSNAAINCTTPGANTQTTTCTFTN